MPRSIYSRGWLRCSWLSNYRMKLTRLRPSVVKGIDTPTEPGTVDRTRLGLQLMRGR